jgi:hypothetical protein
MGITLTFESFEEMIIYAKQLIGTSEIEVSTKKEETPTYQQPIQQLSQQPLAQPTPQQNIPAQGVAYPQASVQNTQTIPAPTQNTPQQQPVQTTQPSYTRDNLAAAAMTLMDSGRQPELLNLLSQFGVDTLPALLPEQYGAFATALRGLGAQI